MANEPKVTERGNPVEASAAVHPGRSGAAPPPRVRVPYVCGGVAPPPRMGRDLQVEDARKGRIINIISRMITGSDPAKKMEAGTFSQDDITEAAYRVASFWIKTSHSDKAEVLAKTYGLDREKVEEMARATSKPPEPRK